MRKIIFILLLSSTIDSVGQVQPGQQPTKAVFIDTYVSPSDDTYILLLEAIKEKKRKEAETKNKEEAMKKEKANRINQCIKGVKSYHSAMSSFFEIKEGFHKAFITYQNYMCNEMTVYVNKEGRIYDPIGSFYNRTGFTIKNCTIIKKSYGLLRVENNSGDIYFLDVYFLGE